MMFATRFTRLAAYALVLSSMPIVTAETAHADDAVAEVPVATSAQGVEPADWSLATGIGYPFAFGGLGGLGGLSSPGASILVGHRLFGPVSLLARVAGSYSRTQLDDSTSANGAMTSTTGMLSLGLRVSLTSPEILDVSAFVLADAYFGESRLGDTQSSTTAGIGGELGLSLDRELVPGFGIRVSTTVVGASYRASKSSSVVAGLETSSTQNGVVFFMGIAPMMELRWSF